MKAEASASTVIGLLGAITLLFAAWWFARIFCVFCLLASPTVYNVEDSFYSFHALLDPFLFLVFVGFACIAAIE